MHRVVVVGGGFGGLNAVRALRNEPVVLTLVDRRNFHLFQPLLYQVATGTLSPANIAAPLRVIVRRQENAEVLLDEVTDFDLANRRVLTRNGVLEYDTLVVAAGARYNYFGHLDWQEIAPSLKSIEDAREIRRRILIAFEAAERERDPVVRRRWLTFVIIGGGPTGVEMAGALAEIARLSLRNDFRRMNPAEATIVILEAQSSILSSYPRELSEKARRSLERRGVRVRTGTYVEQLHPGTVVFRTGSELHELSAKTVLWTAGVRASPLAARLAEASGAECDRMGRIKVRADLTLPDHPEVFVIGDMAYVTDREGAPLAGFAPVAIQQGKYVARAVRARARKERPPGPFRYKDRGKMATVGRSQAVVDLGFVRFAGFVGWLVWLVVHLMQLILFQNRLLVMIQWAWNYLTFSRYAFLITGEPSSPTPLPPPTRAVSRPPVDGEDRPRPDWPVH